MTFAQPICYNAEKSTFVINIQENIMALDGITINALTKELSNRLLGGRISKIAQPEPDELLLTIKSQSANERLLISAGASLPFVYLTADNKPSPQTAPSFCMLLRKHISGGHITNISQPGLERIIEITVDHLNEMGDPCQKILTIELMGKHSNIIFRHPDGTIIDSIKHISALVSSVREVLPGREYFIPKADDKIDLITKYPEIPSGSEINELIENFVLCKPFSIQKALYTSFTGFSPVISESLCADCDIDSSISASSLTNDNKTALSQAIICLINKMNSNDYSPAIILDSSSNPIEFEVLDLSQYKSLIHEKYDSVSEVLSAYYARKNEYTRIRQKSADLRKITQTALERNVKKYDLQAKQLKDTEKMDKYKLYGELLQTYGYSAPDGADKLTCENYYTNEQITIPLDPTLSAVANSQKYYDRYGKLKRTKEAVTEQIEETQAEIMHFRSIAASLDIAVNDDDLTQIKEELIDSGYIRRKGPYKNKLKLKSKPFHYISSDGFHMYAGKNNYQNDELTFKLANSGDWWFHAKKMPGSHVIVRCEGRELTDRAFEEAAGLAAYYSSGKSMDKVEIDYVKRKEVKKPNGSKPGFVVYYTNYSMIARPSIENLTPAE